MKLMGIEALYRKPNLSRRHPEHTIYPYLLRDISVDHSNQVWATDITYIPMRHGFVYLVAIVDWFSRRILSWRLSKRLTTDFCIDALQEANLATVHRKSSTLTKEVSSPTTGSPEY